MRSRLARPRSRAVGITLGLLAGVLALAAVYIANRRLTEVPFPDLLRDPGQVTGASPWVGSLTFVGWFGWTAAAVLLFTAAWLRRRSSSGQKRATFLFVSGVLALVALADDAFQLHERVLVDATGVGERGWYAVWVAGVAAWVVTFRRQLAHPPAELALAAVLLGTSQIFDVGVIDEFADLRPWHRVSWEESLKLLGIGSFTAFAAREVGAAATVALEGASRIITTPEDSGGAGRRARRVAARSRRAR